MVAIIGRVLNLGVISEGAPAGFTDVGSGYWAADAIKQASSAKLIQGVSSSAFAPQNKATRAEAVTLIIRALESDSQIKELIAGL
ncbi:Surface layer protein precursor [compost metagenome]